MAALTPGFTGADIANVCNEAALIAARLRFNKKGVNQIKAYKMWEEYQKKKGKERGSISLISSFFISPLPLSSLPLIIFQLIRRR